MKPLSMLSNIFNRFPKLFFKFIGLALILCLTTFAVKAQDVFATVEVTANRIQGVEQSLFQDLEKKLNDFVNGRKWTNDNLQAQERIKCQFNLVINGQVGDKTFTGTLSDQAHRPFYNTSYTSPVVIIQDSEITFSFESSSVIQFSDQNVAGTEPLLANLSAIFAYYTYMIVGFDYDSFESKGGESYFKKAENIVLNAPSGNGISGWESIGATRNRQVLVSQVLNPRYAELRPLWYEYHRRGLDEMLIRPEEAATLMLDQIPTLKKLAKENTGSFYLQWYFTTKADEWVQILSKAPQEMKKDLVQDFVQMDVTNANKYRRVR